jgi:hypothetical protein
VVSTLALSSEKTGFKICLSNAPWITLHRGPALCGSYDFGDGLVGLSAGAFLGANNGGEGATAGGEAPRLLAQATARPGTRAAVSLSATLQSHGGSTGIHGGAPVHVDSP